MDCQTKALCPRGMPQTIKRYALITLALLIGCSYQRHVTLPVPDLPGGVHASPRENIYGPSKVAVFEFAEPSYAPGTGRRAAETICQDLLKRGVFSKVIDESERVFWGTASPMDLARSEAYDLIITGEVLYHFDGSALQASSVSERIRVMHVATNRLLWHATAASTVSPPPSFDYILVKGMGSPAPPTSALLQRNAEKFCNMLLRRPPQAAPAQESREILLLSQQSAMEGLQKKVDDLLGHNDLLEQQLWEEIQKSEGLIKEVDHLSAQADEMEQQLKEEIERGEIRLKRYETKTVLNLDNSICFDSGSARLKRGVKKSLTKLSKTLKNFPENYIQIEGHTDDLPIHGYDFSSNWDLSSARALAVLKFLLEKGDMDSERLSAAGYGKNRPIVPNDSPEHRRMNRRVDIVVLPSEAH
ncbi:MAG: OmpA family protein [Thermodesulfobacteriota bacterium]|nr:OmpA family protein [Thermodesulfobacteriota bacterium]